MDLYNLIKQHASTQAKAGDFETVADILNAKNIPVENHKLLTAKDLMNLLPTIVDPVRFLTEADIVLGTMQASTHPRVKTGYESMIASGLDIANEQVQTMLPVLASMGNWPSGLLEKVRAFGITYISLAEQHIGSTVTAENCANNYNRGSVADIWTSLFEGGIHEAVIAGDINALRSALNDAIVKLG